MENINQLQLMDDHIYKIEKQFKNTKLNYKKEKNKDNVLEKMQEKRWGEELVQKLVILY